MLLDHQFELCNSQVMCNSGATEASENVYDFGVAAPKVGKGNPLKILFTVEEAFTGTGTTLTITGQSSSDNAVADAYADIPGFTSGALAKAALVAGHQFVMEFPPLAVFERYFRLMFTGDNTFQTTGIISANLVLDVQSNLAPGA